MTYVKMKPNLKAHKHSFPLKKPNQIRLKLFMSFFSHLELQ